MVSFQDQSAIYSRENSVNDERASGAHSVMSHATNPMLSRQTSHSSNIYKKSRGFFRQISKNTSTVIKCVVVVSLLLNILTFLTIGVLVTLLFQNKCPALPNPELSAPDLVCYPCGDQGLPGVPLAQRTDNGFCCASKRDRHVQHLVKSRILPTAEMLKGKPISCDTAIAISDKRQKKKPIIKTVAHLIIDVKKTKDDERVHWSSQATAGGAFMQGGLEIIGDKIKVTKGGVYRIQSHLSFDSISTNDITRVKILDHWLRRVSQGDAMNLQCMKTMLENRRYEASNIMVIVKLRAGDLIGIELSTYQYIYELDISNTLDIEKID